MYLIKSLPVWLLIIFAESVHGTLRQIFLAPLVGDFPARRIAVFTGMILIFLITYLFIERISAPDTKALLLIGLLWTVLTFLFEVVLGIYVLGLDRARIAEDYDPTRGGLMGFGLLFIIFAPWLAARLRQRRFDEYGR